MNKRKLKSDLSNTAGILPRKIIAKQKKTIRTKRLSLSFSLARPLLRPPSLSLCVSVTVCLSLFLCLTVSLSVSHPHTHVLSLFLSPVHSLCVSLSNPPPLPHPRFSLFTDSSVQTFKPCSLPRTPQRQRTAARGGYLFALQRDKVAAPAHRSVTSMITQGQTHGE